MKSNKPLFSLLSGYIFSLLAFRIWYHTPDTPILEVFIVVIVITILYLLLYFLIWAVSSLQKPWKSFLLVSIITLVTLLLIQSVYNEKYRFVRAKEKKFTETIQLIEESPMRKLKAKINDANKTITLLKEMVMSEQNENDRLRKQLDEVTKKSGSVEEEIKPNKDVIMQAKMNKIFSKINTEKVHADLDKYQEIIFKIQIISSSTPLAKNSPRFKGLKNIWEYKDNDLYKYTVGSQKDLKSILPLQSKLRKKGFTGAFVIAFKNNKRIPVREALKLLK